MKEYICKYCNRKLLNAGALTVHEHCCKLNPDRKSYYHSSNAGRKKGKTYYVWNKGLTKETDERIMKSWLKVNDMYKNGLIKPSFKGKVHSKETKQHMSELMKNRYKNGWDSICGRSKKYKYTMKDGSIITVDGSWEYHVAEYLDKNNINWKRNTKRFEYINLKGNKSTYKPDFYLIDTPGLVNRGNIINYVDGYLKEKDRGQYFITINKSEIASEDLEDFRKKSMIVAEFDREHGDEHRFFGCKY